MSLKADAEALRAGLIAGIVAPPDVVRWADAIIEADRIDEAPAVLDLSLAGIASLAEVVSLLGTVPGEADAPAVGRRLASQLYHGLLSNELDVVQVARAMYRLMREGYAPDGDFENMAYSADDDVDHALNDHYISLEEVREYVLPFLERYRISGQVPLPPAA